MPRGSREYPRHMLNQSRQALQRLNRGEWLSRRQTFDDQILGQVVPSWQTRFLRGLTRLGYIETAGKGHAYQYRKLGGGDLTRLEPAVLIRAGGEYPAKPETPTDVVEDPSKNLDSNQAPAVENPEGAGAISDGEVLAQLLYVAKCNVEMLDYLRRRTDLIFEKIERLTKALGE